MTMQDEDHSLFAFRHVWRRLDALADLTSPAIAHQFALQVVYLRCRSASLWMGLVRHSGQAEPALSKAWAGLGLDRAFNLGTGSAAKTRQLFGEADQALAGLIAEVDRLENPSGLFDACLDRYSSRYAKGGDYYTPQSLARLFVGLAAPRAGECVLDPVCGCGRLLIAAARWAGQEDGVGELRLHGRDIRPEARRAAAMNLTLNALRPDLGVSAVDSLRLGPTGLSADVVLANVPLNMKDWGHQELTEDPRWSFGLPPRGNANFAWVQHSLSELSPQGRAVVLLPDSAARSTNVAETRIRQALVENDLVAGVVALPTRLFPHTRTGTTLWLFSKDKKPHGSWGRSSRAGEILFVDARRLGTSTDRSGRHLKDEHIDHICRIFAAWRGIGSAKDEDVPEAVSWCRTARQDDIVQRGYDLSPSSYVNAPSETTKPALGEQDERRPREVLYEHFRHAARINLKLRRVLEVQPAVADLKKALPEREADSARRRRQSQSEPRTLGEK
ncbi:N-6 DNA methylase [Streptomyces iakyrus]|uniref:N-6 DNA methylase n=1 Tax=Streptomyces iakyrus TaxID=68219 RepID=UPI0037F5EEFD